MEVQIVVFRLQNKWYGLYINRVKEIFPLVKITRVPRTPSYILGVINLRGTVVPVLSLHRLFGLPEPLITEESRIIILTEQEGMFGVLADEISSVTKVGEDQIQTDIYEKYIDAFVKLPDRVVMVLKRQFKEELGWGNSKN
ncbi:purine-binding chemotaxis protein CheW [Carboxydocella sporoproducens DSM 16521]|uniref:Purine-binding chemotaxis protein CheW n=2 Tax=Carboxydocella TaxID=178898 RepID=A0A1T4P9K7_9FIRM|nr:MULTISPECIES: chemotaxis protein CheW [Carboxydocella]AVX20747.1 purine-binding chemotaxis protein CheW [Carboxydocella thermautotrophica]GAW28276.1 chemotaxis protein CheW [Carboxydocella sp. ULO1]SJZ87926.1 purine-binding chemotaxis protein CheW [Carboxydocella sporoproducens DSM 16521]